MSKRMPEKFTREEDAILKQVVDGLIDLPSACEQINKSEGVIKARLAYLAILFSGKDLSYY